MTYKVFIGPTGSDKISPLEREQALFKELDTLDDALAFAHAIKRKGMVPLQIEGDDGTRLDKSQIATALQHRDAEVAT